MRRLTCFLLTFSSFALHAGEPAPQPALLPGKRDRITEIPAPKGDRIIVAPVTLPALPDGVEELRFADFFQMPIGPKGLELTARLRALDGRTVRVFGHMVREDPTPCNSCVAPRSATARRAPAWLESIVPGRMLFTEHRAAISHAHYGLADDLPPQTIFIEVPEKAGELVPFTPGPMLLTGVLSVGPRNEPDSRISLVRLKLDPPAALAAAPLSAGAPLPAANPQTTP